MKKNVTKALFILILCIVSLATFASSTVKINAGLLKGEQVEGGVVFRGIPYAAPPVGELRWRAPQAFPSWEGVRDATVFGAACKQQKRPSKSLKLAQSEDCLTLNIWQPMNTKKALPVMVWIHGGAFRFGAGSLPFYDGVNFAKQGVILLTFNYRLGRFGFFAHDSLSQEQQSAYPDELLANYGLMDQLHVLQWVQDNIAAFGGDPNNVTIFGESAGGVSVNYLMTSPLAKGLFNKAISQSGGGFNKVETLNVKGKYKQIAYKSANAWLDKLKLKKTDAKTLRSLSADKLLLKVGGLELGFGPIIDGTLIRHNISEGFLKGNLNADAYMVGANDYEASLMKATKMSAGQVFKTLGASAKPAKKIYAKEGISDREVLAQQLYGDALFVAPARYMAAQASKYIPVWNYHFAYVPEIQRKKKPGAGHGMEIPFVFGVLDKLPMARFWLKETDLAVSQNIMAYWLNFAKSGKPDNSLKTTVKWPQFKRDEQNTLLFSNNGPMVLQDMHKTRLDFHQKAYEESLKHMNMASF